MRNDENLLNDFENKYLKTRRRNRYLLIGIIILIIIIIGIILIFTLKGNNQNQEDNQNQNQKQKNQDQNPDQDQEEELNPDKDQEEEQNTDQDQEEEQNQKKEEEEKSEEHSDPCPEIKEIGGSQSGFATRYWDCCKPSCSWPNNGGTGNEAKQCDVNMNIITDPNSKSICDDGGVATTCLSQIPFTINGCDNIGFAFAASPGESSKNCGKCYLLEFTGEGKYETQKNHKLLLNKKLIIMSTNIGYDVAGGQFDIMIPGGGVGQFNGCSEILGNNLGKRYGGLLSNCEEEVGWSGSEDYIYTKRKECLQKKCNETFSSNTQAKEGCLFLANFLEAAGNPIHNYKEIECPKVLKDRY